MKRLFSSLLAAALFWPGLATAQSVRLSVPDTTAPRGSEILLPVRVDSSLTGRNVTAFEFQFQINDQLADPDSVILAGTMLDGIGWSILTHRPASNLYRIAGAGTMPLSGTGVLFYVRMRLKAQGWSPFTFSEPAHNLLNQGDPPITMENGSVSVEAAPSIGISPDGDVLAVGERRTFTAYSGQTPYLWSTTDPTIATIASDGQLTALTRGSTYVVVQDATGLRDTTNQPVVVRAMGIGVPDTTVYAGSTLDLPVSVTSLTSLGVTAGSFRLEFNGDLLTPTAVLTAGTVLQSVPPVVNLGVKGRAEVSFATATPLTGSGILFIVRFQAASTSSWSGMTIAQGLFNQDMPPKVHNGSVSLASLSTIWMSMSRLTLMAGDSLFITPGNGQAPYTWTTTDTTVARMDATGHLIGLRSGTVRVVVRDALGAQGTSDEFQVFDGSVRIPDMVAASGGWVEVPVLLERLTPGTDISSFQMRLSYDSTYIRFDSVLAAGTLTGTWAPTFHSAPPVLTIAGATAAFLSSTGTLLKVRFAVKPSISTGTQAGVRVDQLLFNEGLPHVETKNGIITIAGLPEASSLWSPGDGWTGLSVTPSFQWGGVAYAETYHLQIATDTSFTSLVVNDSTLTTTTTVAGPLANGTSHYWRVRAKNSVGSGPWTSFRSFRTVASLAGAPVLAEPAMAAVGVDVNPTFRWHPSMQAETYQIQFAEDSLFATMFHFSTGLTDTSYTWGPFEHLRTYYWRTRAVNEAGPGAWSLAWPFRTIIAVAAAPTLDSPVSGATGVGLPPTLRWRASSDAVSYGLQLATNSSFSAIVVDTSGMLDTMLTAVGLQNLRDYYWRVRAANAAGNGAWTGTWTFQTIVAATVIPALAEPASGSMGVSVTPTLKWQTAVNAASYHVQVAEDSAFSALIIDATGLTDTTYSSSALQLDRDYFWHVRASNAAGTSGFSTTWRFRTTGPGGVESEHGIVPTEFGLDHNYPNPFNPGTRIAFRLPEESWVTLTVYNIRGSEVDRLVAERLPAGAFHVWWDASQLPSGVYICRMVAGRFTSAQRMLLLK